MKPLISNIQRFSVHDGPGIRTTVFFKGCSLHCPWCANPENISFENEFYKSGEEIIPWGEHINEDSLYEKVTLDRAFYGKEGGVTFSGGEPLLFLPHYENFLKRAKQERLSIGVETALFVSLDNLICLNQYVDFYYIDLKILIEDECMNILGGKLETFFRNLEWLYQNVSKERIIYRIPLVPSTSNIN